LDPSNQNKCTRHGILGDVAGVCEGGNMYCPKCGSDNLHLADECNSGLCTYNGCHDCNHTWYNIESA
jgi:hypothetical protein